MSEPNPSDPRCFEGGSVGGPQIVLPSDPARYKRDFNDRTACNRLWCPTCNSWVKHLDGFRLGGSMSPQDKLDLYDSPDPANTSFVTKNAAGDQFRIYYCRQSAHSFGGYDDVELTDFGWKCGGHPQ